MSLKIKKHLLAISLPIIIISICIFWIVRLELNAAVLASRVDDLHNSLKQNKDELTNLQSFFRTVNDAQVFIDNSGVYLFKDKSRVMVGDIGGKTVGGKPVQTMRGVWLQESNTGSIVIAKDKGIGIKNIDKNGITISTGKGEDFHIKLSPDKGTIELKKDKSEIFIGEMITSTGSKKTGIYFGEKDGGTIAVTKENGIGIKTRDGKGLEFHSGTKNDFYIKLSPDLNQVLLKKGKSEIQVGQTKYGDGLLIERMDSQIQLGQTIYGEGVTLGEKQTGTLSIVKGKGLAIKTGGLNEMHISGEDKLVIDFKGNIDINAWGDLNLNSLNGNVNLVGKRINLNE